jgi:hypothetical protein
MVSFMIESSVGVHRTFAGGGKDKPSSWQGLDSLGNVFSPQFLQKGGEDHGDAMVTAETITQRGSWISA